VAEPPAHDSDDSGSGDDPPTATGKGVGSPRHAARLARDWLGANPRTSRPHLPFAYGDEVYRIEDLLLDADLFRRLRIRGTARGPEGITDLTAALQLVTGAPFDGRGVRDKDGYKWVNEDRLDHHYTVMVEDTAHLVATHALGAGDTATARAAAETALRIGSGTDVPLLDLVAVCGLCGIPHNRHYADRRIMRTGPMEACCGRRSVVKESA